MKYNLSIIDISRTMLAFLLTVAFNPISLCIILYLNYSFPKNHPLITAAIGFVFPLCLFFIWLSTKKNKDTFNTSEKGIESETHGIIKWTQIKFCSWETYSVSTYILFVLKNNKWIYITVPSSKYTEQEAQDLESLYDEIKTYSNEKSFKLFENKVANFRNPVGLTLVILVFIAIFIAILIDRKVFPLH